MKPHNHRLGLGRVAVGIALASAAALASCGANKPFAANVPLTDDTVPTTPMPMPGQAHLTGVVRNVGGAGVSGATVRIAETDATAMTDATGAYELMVPSDSTLTLVTSATGYATSFRESIVLADMAMATGFDLTLMTATDLARVNTLAVADQAATRGLMALRLHSLSATCKTAGARVSVWPPLAATVFYGHPSAAGGLDEPDAALTGVQAGAHVDVWLAGAIPPGNMYRISVDQPGCALAAEAPSQGGVQLTGMRHVDVQAFTEADLFLQ